jgi:hypothetical protein
MKPQILPIFNWSITVAAFRCGTTDGTELSFTPLLYGYNVTAD